MTATMNPLERRKAQFPVIILIAALIYGLGLILRGPTVQTTDPAAFAAWITAPSFRWAYLLITLGMVGQLFGFWALYLRLAHTRVERLALIALVGSVTGVAINITIQGLALLAPEAYPAVYRLLASTPPMPIMVALGLVQLAVLGALLFGVALSRSGEFPWWVAPTYVLHRLAFDFGAAIGFSVELSGVLWLLISGLGILLVRQSLRSTSLASQLR